MRSREITQSKSRKQIGTETESWGLSPPGGQAGQEGPGQPVQTGERTSLVESQSQEKEVSPGGSSCAGGIKTWRHVRVWTLRVASITSEAGSLACADAADQSGDTTGPSAHSPVRNGEEWSWWERAGRGEGSVGSWHDVPI